VVNFKGEGQFNHKSNSHYKLLHGTTFQVHINLSHVYHDCLTPVPSVAHYPY
jgi:hypothetical protein